MSGQVGDCLPSPPPTSRALLMYPEVPHLPRLQASLWCPLVPPLEKVIVRSFSFWYLCLAGSQTYSFLEIIMIMAFFFPARVSNRRRECHSHVVFADSFPALVPVNTRTTDHYVLPRHPFSAAWQHRCSSLRIWHPAAGPSQQHHGPSSAGGDISC